MHAFSFGFIFQWISLKYCQIYCTYIQWNSQWRFLLVAVDMNTKPWKMEVINQTDLGSLKLEHWEKLNQRILNWGFTVLALHILKLNWKHYHAGCHCSSWFKSHPSHQISWLRFLMFSSVLLANVRIVFCLDNECFLPILSNSSLISPFDPLLFRSCVPYNTALQKNVHTVQH